MFDISLSTKDSSKIIFRFYKIQINYTISLEKIRNKAKAKRMRLTIKQKGEIIYKLRAGEEKKVILSEEL